MLVKFYLKNFHNFKDSNLISKNLIEIEKDINHVPRKFDFIVLRYENMLLTSEINKVIIDLTEEKEIFSVYGEIRKIEKE
ncbi:MAG: hypothetical protein NZZ41_00910 [Candidatus Dojkabacteria bacterium]|nr:hypothetical protein [Candidatus Dojkabacteria bacterium]